jgi:hypothetical protein
LLQFDGLRGDQLRVAPVNDAIPVHVPMTLEVFARIERAGQHEGVENVRAAIAVDSTRRTEGAEGTTVPVAVPVPEGVKYETTVEEK